MKKPRPMATLYTNNASSPAAGSGILLSAAAAVLALLGIMLLSCTGRGYADPVSTPDDPGRTTVRAASSESGGPVSASPDESWFLVAEVKGDTRNYNVYVDTSTIQTVDGEVMSWSKLVFPEDQKDSDGLIYREVRIASAINCAQRTYMYSASKFYDALGRMVFHETIETERSPIPGGTVSEYIANFVCGYKPPASTGGSAPPPSTKSP